LNPGPARLGVQPWTAPTSPMAETACPVVGIPITGQRLRGGLRISQSVAVLPDSLSGHEHNGSPPCGAATATATPRPCAARSACGPATGATGSAQELGAELSRSAGIPADLLIQTVMYWPNERRGTWVHRRVAVHLATWCNPELAVRVSGWHEPTVGKSGRGADRVEPRPPRQRRRS